ALAELMVGLGEEIRAVHRVGIDAGGNERTRVLDGQQLRIDRSHIRGRNGDEAGLVQLPLLKVREIESAVADDRAAETRSVLRLRQWERGIRKRVIGVEALVAEITIEVAMQRVGAAFRNHVDVSAQ